MDVGNCTVRGQCAHCRLKSVPAVTMPSAWTHIHPGMTRVEVLEMLGSEHQRQDDLMILSEWYGNDCCTLQGWQTWVREFGYGTHTLNVDYKKGPSPEAPTVVGSVRYYTTFNIFACGYKNFLWHVACE